MSKQPKNQPNPPGNRRAQLQQQREQEARERKVRNIITFSILGVAVLAIVGVVVGVALTAAKPPVSDNDATTGDYSVVVGKADAPVTLTIFQDFMCPYCGDFERANRADLEALVADGTAKIAFHTLNFQDGNSAGSKYSTRSANAFVAVAKAEPDKLMAFNAALYDNQPQEGTPGLSDAEIADRARQAGVSETVIATFAQLHNADFVNKATAQALDQSREDSITGTPTIRINGTDWPSGATGEQYQAGPLKAAVLEAAGKK